MFATTTRQASPDNQHPSFRWVLFGVGGGLFILYALTAQTRLAGEDSALFILSCANGDIAHAPGYPLYALLCRPFSWLPSVSPPLAAALFSAAAAAAACSVFCWLLYRLTRSLTAAVGGSVLFGVSRSFWGQANIPEVYTLNAFLFFLAWWCLYHWRESPTVKSFALFVFVCALATSNHWPLFLLAAGGFPFLMWRHWQWFAQQIKIPHFWCAITIALILGISPYGYLIWRTHHPAAFLGLPFAPTDWTSFWQIVSRDLFFITDNQQGVTWQDKQQFIFFLLKQSLWRETGFIGGGLLIIGCVRQWRSAGAAMSAFLSFVFLSTTVGLVLLLNFLYDEKNAQVFSVYPLLAYAAACVWSVLALNGKWRQWALGIACTYALVVNFPANNHQHDTLASDIADIYLRTMPDNSSLLLSDNLTRLVKTQHYLNASTHRRDISILAAPNPYQLEMRYPGKQLYPPNSLPYEEEVRLLNAYVKTHHICYNTYIPFTDARPSQEHLLFSCLRPPDAAAAIINPDISDFLRRLGEQYTEINNWETQQKTGYIVYNAVYTMLFLQGQLQLPDAWKPLLEKLSTSPPGALAVLEFLVQQPTLAISARRAETFKKAVNKSLPHIRNRRQRVRFLSALGDIFAAVTPRTPNATKQARHYHRRAAADIPAADSLGVRRALAFYQRENMTKEIAALRSRYGAIPAANANARWE